MSDAELTSRGYVLPANEDERLRELLALQLPGAGPIEQVDRVCALARDLFKVPFALVTLIGADKQTFLSQCGVDLTETRREDALCSVAILGDEPLVVRDASRDPRFKENVFVCGPAHLRFYAGAPLRMRSGINIGTLCVADTSPRMFRAEEQAHLTALAEMIVSAIRGWHDARALKAGQARLAQTARLTKIGSYEFNPHSGHLIWDDEIYPIYGIPPGTPPSHELIVSRYDPEMREISRKRLLSLFRYGVPYEVELRGTRPNGEVFWVRALAEAEFSGGKVTRVFGAIQDITERKLAEEHIKHITLRDALTGLPNRGAFIDELNGVIAEARMAGRRVTLVNFDVDHFRDINDALGHHIGDKLLRNIAGGLTRGFDGTGTVSRIAGDEFAVIMGDHSPDHARRLTALSMEHAKTLSRADHLMLPLGMSGGMAVFPDHGDDAEAIMKNARLALLQAKSHGRGHIGLFEPMLRKSIDDKKALIRRIWTGIANHEFILHYQPIVGLRGGQVTGLEALMRWNDPERGILPPAEFMVAFDEPDVSVALGEVALDLAISQMRLWLDAGVEFGSVAVNLSTAQFRLPDLAATILGKLERFDVPPQRLTLEVTENVYMAWGAEIVAATVRKLHEAGVGIALDDFGTGYASLTHLRQFPIDTLKIDKSFVQSAESGAIVDAVINMGLSLGMQVVAEGVEKPEQLSLLRLKGCDFVQGFIFAKPMEPARIAAFIADFAAGTPQEMKKAVSH